MRMLDRERDLAAGEQGLRVLDAACPQRTLAAGEQVHRHASPCRLRPARPARRRAGQLQLANAPASSATWPPAGTWGGSRPPAVSATWPLARLGTGEHVHVAATFAKAKPVPARRGCWRVGHRMGLAATSATWPPARGSMRLLLVDRQSPGSISSCCPDPPAAFLAPENWLRSVESGRDVDGAEHDASTPDGVVADAVSPRCNPTARFGEPIPLGELNTPSSEDLSRTHSS